MSIKEIYPVQLSGLNLIVIKAVCSCRKSNAILIKIIDIKITFLVDLVDTQKEVFYPVAKFTRLISQNLQLKEKGWNVGI